MTRCCLFWFSLPGPYTTFCVWQRYGHNIDFYILLHTPSIILTTHYLPLIWAQEKPLIFDNMLLVCFGSVLQFTWTTFVPAADMGIIFTIKCFYIQYCTSCIIFDNTLLVTLLIWAPDNCWFFDNSFTSICLFWLFPTIHLGHICPCCFLGHNICFQKLLHTPFMCLSTNFLWIFIPEHLVILW